MKDIDFLTQGYYVSTKNFIDRKIYFNVTNTELKNKSKCLYTPLKFSGILFKYFLFFIPKFRVSFKSDIIKLIENRIGINNFNTSLYLSTDRKKRILLIIDDNGEYFLKISSNKKYNNILKNEINKSKLFSEFNTPNIIAKGELKSHFFFMTKKIKFSNKLIDFNEIVKSLKTLKREKIKLSNHIFYKKAIKTSLNIYNYNKYLKNNRDKLLYSAVEHGDFTPWNFKLSQENREWS